MAKSSKTIFWEFFAFYFEKRSYILMSLCSQQVCTKSLDSIKLSVKDYIPLATFLRRKKHNVKYLKFRLVSFLRFREKREFSIIIFLKYPDPYIYIL